MRVSTKLKALFCSANRAADTRILDLMPHLAHGNISGPEHNPERIEDDVRTVLKLWETGKIPSEEIPFFMDAILIYRGLHNGALNYWRE